MCQEYYFAITATLESSLWEDKVTIISYTQDGFLKGYC